MRIKPDKVVFQHGHNPITEVKSRGNRDYVDEGRLGMIVVRDQWQQSTSEQC